MLISAMTLHVPSRDRPGCQPLTAPLVRPATIRRWKTRTMMMTGMVTTTDAAAIAVMGDWKFEAPVKNASAAGTGRALLVDVRDTPGNAAIASATDRMNRLPGKSSRAIA